MVYPPQHGPQCYIIAICPTILARYALGTLLMVLLELLEMLLENVLIFVVNVQNSSSPSMYVESVDA
jgi:hypothetical protein